MREIKFRVWDDDRDSVNQLLYFDLGTDLDRQMLFYSKMGLMRGELMQYTGLKDKNGKEIYEGDIIRFTKGTRCYEVAFMYAGFKRKLGNEGNCADIHEPDDWDIVGNIYENPELLEA